MPHVDAFIEIPRVLVHVGSRFFCNRSRVVHARTHASTYVRVVRYHFPLFVIDKHIARAQRRTEFLISLFALSHARLIHACMRSRCINVEIRGYAARLSECRVRLSREICMDGERGRIVWVAIYVKQ